MACNHLTSLSAMEPDTYEGCDDCLPIGGTWLHLRLCMECGHVGCCDDSPHRHGTAHNHATGHPVMQSFEPGERWAWCYVHGDFLEDIGAELSRSYA